VNAASDEYVESCRMPAEARAGRSSSGSVKRHGGCTSQRVLVAIPSFVPDRANRWLLTPMQLPTTSCALQTATGMSVAIGAAGRLPSSVDADTATRPRAASNHADHAIQSPEAYS
jgi:hypothetical protein